MKIAFGLALVCLAACLYFFLTQPYYNIDPQGYVDAAILEIASLVAAVFFGHAGYVHTQLDHLR